jgi:hypothetical protein
MSDKLLSRERYGEAFWRAHHEAWRHSELNQREYCEAQGIPLKAFGNWRAKFKAEPLSLSEIKPEHTDGVVHQGLALAECARWPPPHLLRPDRDRRWWCSACPSSTASFDDDQDDQFGACLLFRTR